MGDERGRLGVSFSSPASRNSSAFSSALPSPAATGHYSINIQPPDGTGTLSGSGQFGRTISSLSSYAPATLERTMSTTAPDILTGPPPALHELPVKPHPLLEKFTELQAPEKQWLSYYRHHELLPLVAPVGGVAVDPAAAGTGTAPSVTGAPAGVPAPGTVLAPRTRQGPRDGKLVPYYLAIQRISGVRVPEHLVRMDRLERYGAIDSKLTQGARDSGLFYRLQLSLFDAKNRRFFGRTWVGPDSPLLKPTNSASGISLPRQSLAFRSSIHDDSCFAVAELVLLVKEKGAVTERYGIGWTTINLFGRGTGTLDLPDVAEEGIDVMRDDGKTLEEIDFRATASISKHSVMGRPFFQGTPRALMFIDQVAGWEPSFDWLDSLKLKRAGDVKLWYELYTHKALIPMYHLFRENEFLGDNDEIGGLPAILSGNVEHSLISHLPRNPRHLISLAFPGPPFAVKIQHPLILLPYMFEERMKKHVQRLRDTMWVGEADRGEHGRIVSRLLHVGIHNGRTFLHDPRTLSLQVVEDEAVKKGGRFRSRASIVATGEEAKRIAEAANRPLTASTVPEGTMTRLLYEGDFQISGLQCMVRNDKFLAIVFELEYVIQWFRKGVKAHRASSSITAGWGFKLLSSSDISLAGNRQFVCLQRGPMRSISNHRTFGFSPRDLEQPAPTIVERNIWLHVALTSPGFESRKPSNLRDLEIPRYDAAAITPVARNELLLSPAVRSESPLPPSPKPAAVNTHLLRPAQPLLSADPIPVPVMITPPPDPLRLPQPPLPIPSATPTGMMTGSHVRMLEPNEPAHQGQVRLRPDLPAPELLARPMPPHPSAYNMPPTVMSGPNKDIDLGREFTDALKATHFTLQFKQFSQNYFSFAKNPVLSLIFTFQFYNQPPFVSRRHQLILPAPDERMDLRAVEDYHSVPFLVEYQMSLPAEQHRMFIEYMYTRTLVIDIWDGDSLFHIGCAYLPLQQFLRQGYARMERSNVLDLHELPLLGSTGAPDGNGLSAAKLATGAGAAHKGRLVVAVSHLGQPVTGHAEASYELSEARTIPSVSQSIILSRSALPGSQLSTSLANADVNRSMSRSRVHQRQQPLPDPLNTSVNLSASQGRKVKARAIADKDPEIRMRLAGDQGLTGNNTSSANLSMSRSRISVDESGMATPGRTRHRKSTHAKQRTVTRYPLPADELQAREDNLRKITDVRDRTRDSAIDELLRETITQERTIYPSFGQLIFWEVIFTNPYPKRHVFAINIMDPAAERRSAAPPEINIVTDLKEWLFYKQAYGANTPTQHGMFDRDRASAVMSASVPLPSTAAAPATSSSSGETKSSDPAGTSTVAAATAGASGSLTSRIESATLRYIVLEPSETVWIPFRFQSFKCGQPIESRLPGGAAFPVLAGVVPQPVHDMIRDRHITITLENQQKETVVKLTVAVKPLSFAIDRTIRFHHWEDQVMTAELPLPTTYAGTLQPSLGGIGGDSNNLLVRHSRFNDTTLRANDVRGPYATGAPSNTHLAGVNHQTNLAMTHSDPIVEVRCSSDDMIYRFSEDENKHVQLSFTVVPKKWPTVTRIFFSFYTDKYSCGLHSIFQVFIHAHFQTSITAICGQNTPGQLFLPAMDRARNVQCFASSPNEIRWPTDTQFHVEAGRPTGINFNFRTMFDGRRNMLLHLNDIDTHELLASWLVHVAVAQPKLSAAPFMITIKVGQSARRQFQYENPWRIRKTFHFESSQPERVRLQDQRIEIPPDSAAPVNVFIEPRTSPGNESVFLFIKGDEGNTLDTLQLNLTYTL